MRNAKTLCVIIMAIGASVACAGSFDVSLATIFGGTSKDSVNAVAVTKDGVFIIAGSGSMPTVDADIPQPSFGSGGFLIRYDPQLGRIITAAHTNPVHDMEIGPDESVYISAGGIMKLDPTCTKQIWSAGGGKRLSVSADGEVFALSNKRVTHIDAKGNQKSTWNVPAGGRGADICVDRKGKRVITCGSQFGRGAGAPVFIPWAHGFDQTGKHLWKAYGWTGKEVNSVRDMADSFLTRATMGADGGLYMLGNSDGGNTPFRHDPLKLGAPAKQNGGGGEMYKAFTALKVTYVGRFDPASGALQKGRWFYGKWRNEKMNREEIGNTLGRDMAADERGRLHMVGNVQCKLPWTSDAVHTDFAGVGGHKGKWGHTVGPQEMFLVIFGPNLGKPEYCSGFGQGRESDTVLSEGRAVAAARGQSCAGGRFKSPPEAHANATASRAAFLRNSWSDKWQGGGDAYFALAGPGVIRDTRKWVTRAVAQSNIEGKAHLQKALSRGGIAQAIKQLEAQAEKDKGLGARLPRIKEWAQKLGDGRFAAAKRLEGSSPQGAMKAYEAVAELWRGAPIGEKAKARLAELKKDKSFQNGLAADEILGKITAIQARLRDVKGAAASYADLAYFRANRAALSMIQSHARTLQSTRYSAAPAAAKAADVCATLEIPLSKDDIAAFRVYGMFAQALARLRPVPGAKASYTDAKYRKRNGPQLIALAQAAAALSQRYPSSMYTRRALAYVEKYDLPGPELASRGKK